MSRTAWHLRVGAVVAAWLAAAAVVGLRALVVDVDPWLPIHLLLLGAVSNAILVWGTYFTEALLRLPPRSGRREEASRLVVFNAGALCVTAGMTFDVGWSVLAGAALAATAAGWHGVVLLRRLARSLPARFGMTVRYYVVAPLLLPLGVGLGVLLARGDLDDETHARVALAHVALNVLGWVGLTVLGTLVTLWPTMLRTRVADGVERAARTALPVLVAGVLVTAAGALVGSRAAAVIGLLCYVAGLVVSGRPLADAARRKVPAAYATWSVGAAYLWLVGSVSVLALVVAVRSDWASAALAADRLGAPLLVGFAAQVLVGALSYLVPVVLGGGPTTARATGAVLDTAALGRVVLVNVGLLVATLVEVPAVRDAAGAVVVLTLAAFLPLAVRAVVVARRSVPSGPASPA